MEDMLDMKNLFIEIKSKIEKCEAEFKENEIQTSIEIYEQMKVMAKTYGEMNKIINRLLRELRCSKPNSKIPTLLKDNLEKELNDLLLTDRSGI